MNPKLLKWLTPVICYILFMGLFFASVEIETLILGPRPSDQPVILPSWVLFIFFFPLIPGGYVFLPFAQYMYRKRPKRFKIFAGVVILIAFLLLILLEYLRVGRVYRIGIVALFHLFLLQSFYSIPYFLILAYAMKKEMQYKAVKSSPLS